MRPVAVLTIDRGRWVFPSVAAALAVVKALEKVPAVDTEFDNGAFVFVHTREFNAETQSNVRIEAVDADWIRRGPSVKRRLRFKR